MYEGIRDTSISVDRSFYLPHKGISDLGPHRCWRVNVRHLAAWRRLPLDIHLSTEFILQSDIRRNMQGRDVGSWCSIVKLDAYTYIRFSRYEKHSPPRQTALLHGPWGRYRGASSKRSAFNRSGDMIVSRSGNIVAEDNASQPGRRCYEPVLSSGKRPRHMAERTSTGGDFGRCCLRHSWECTCAIRAREP